MPGLARLLFVLTLLLGALPVLAADGPTTPTQSVELFNGEDLTGWFFDVPDAEAAAASVTQEGGVVRLTGQPVGALLTEAEYTDYVLTLQWRWPEGAGNSGVLVHATGSRVAGPWPKCLEPQLQAGDAGDLHGIGGFRYHADHKDEAQTGGRAMNLTDDSEHAVGEWNTMHVICEGDTVRVFVNGVLVNACHDVETSAGRIGLQSEGVAVEFRNMVLHPLVVTPSEPIDLFDGESLAGWTSDIDHGAALTDVFSVEAGVLKDAGRPAGVIRTVQEFRDYELEVQWRWPGGGGNSGLLVHCSSPREMGPWPKCLEVQLGSGNAGDFWRIGLGVTVSDEQTTQGRRTINTADDSEHALGEWNTMVVRCEGDTIRVWVNGDEVNAGWAIEVDHGAICLQSEGTPIEFRKVQLRPLE
ncbi:MAG: DUF1080 domain-containing protein [Phycisphaerales bacterium JB063]